MHVSVLKILGLAIPMHTSFPQDFPQLIFQQGASAPQPPLKLPMGTHTFNRRQADSVTAIISVCFKVLSLSYIIITYLEIYLAIEF